VPAYFTQAERHAMLDAAKIVGLNVLRLMHDTTAAALSYGIYKTDLPADKATNVVFLDMGASDTTVSIVSFVKGKLSVLSTACDRRLGGRDFNELLVDHFRNEWLEKHKIDAYTNAKAMFRLRTAADKQKKVLSANANAPISVECFMNDIDVKGVMERDHFATMCEPLFEKLQKVIQRAFDGCGLPMEEIASVEVLGGSVRIPAVQEMLAKFFGRECSKTLNFDECVAKGSALQCAMLSPAFKVRDFSVNDVSMYPIALSWTSSSGAAEGGGEGMEVDGDEKADAPAPKTGSNTVVFAKFNTVPNTKMLTFYRKDTFTLTAAYSDEAMADQPSGFPQRINEYTISNIPPGPLGDDGTPGPAKIKVKLRLDIHGCLELESAVAIEEELVDEEPPPAPEVVKVPPPAADAPPAADGEAAPAADADAAPAAEGEAAEAAPAPPAEPAAEATAEPPKKKKKIKRIALKVEAKQIGMSSKEMMDAQEAEANMAHSDRLVQETSDAMNELESYVYAMRDAISTRYSKFATEEEASSISAKLTASEDWLYDEGADATKAVYVAKLDELKADVASIIAREREADDRPEAFKALEAALAKYVAFAESTDEEYAHVEKEQKEKVASECAAAQAWMAELQGKIEGMAPTADPPFKAAEVTAKVTTLSSTCEPILRTPKPLPKVEPAPEPAADAPAADGEAPAADGEAAADADAPAADGEAPKPTPDNMDVD
jgi:heat shock protein 4